MGCGCRWGWFGTVPCPQHHCGQPSQDDVDAWIMLEDRSPHPRVRWLEGCARAATGLGPPVEAAVDLDSGLVVLRRPIMGETWSADTHLTGRVVREVLDWDILAEVTVLHTGEVVRR